MAKTLHANIYKYIIAMQIILAMINCSIAYCVDTEINEWAEKDIIIIYSSDNYKEAIEYGKAASLKLDTEFKHEQLIENPVTGLTLSQENCKKNGFDYPCYVPRGRYDDGKYISVEYSKAYMGINTNKYIVIAMSDYRRNRGKTNAEYNIIKKAFPLSCISTVKIYMGCIH